MQNHRSPMNLIATILLCAAISACGGRATVLPSPVPSPTQNQDPTRAAVTRIVMTATTVPQTPSPTATILPSSTATLLPATIDVNATQRAQIYAVTETAVAGFPQTCKDTYPNSQSISPGGNWLASSCGYKRDQSLEVVNREGKRYVMLFKDFLVAEDVQNGVGLGALYPTRWINDEYLYFAAHPGLSGGGICFYGIGASALHRIDLKTGIISAILNPQKIPRNYIFAFSPGGGKLAYEVNSRVTIVDFGTSESRIITEGERVTGDFTWSPDGKKLAYATCKADLDLYLIEQSSVQLYDLEAGKTITILQVEGNRHLYVDSWKENEGLKIRESDVTAGEEIEFVYDESSGQIVTPTP